MADRRCSLTSSFKGGKAVTASGSAANAAQAAGAGTVRGGIRKIIPYKSSTPNTPEHIERTWRDLRAAIKCIQSLDSSELSFEELYRSAYNLVHFNFGAKLYAGVCDVVAEHMAVLAQRVEDSLQSGFLLCLRKVWEEHTAVMCRLHDILLYMDAVYVKPGMGMERVYEMGVARFRDEVIRKERISTQLRQLLLRMVRDERSGDVINRQELKNATAMLVSLGVSSRAVYEDDFEKSFMADSVDFYQQESQRLLKTCTVSEYLVRCEERLQEEALRVQQCLDSSSRSKIIRIVEREMIDQHMEELINLRQSGLCSMIDCEKIEDLARMMSLFSRIKGAARRSMQAGHARGGEGLLLTALQKHLETVGKQLVDEQSENRTSIKTVQMILELYQRHQRILTQAFCGKPEAKRHIMNGLSTVVNHNRFFVEDLSLFIDEKLRRGSKEVSEDSLERCLQDALSLFCLLEDKDMFERYFRQHLAKRLLHIRAAVEGSEDLVVSRLFMECGHGFTAKLEGMHKDIKLSKDVMDSFTAFLAKQANPPGFQAINVRILTAGCWPLKETARCNLPEEIRPICALFEQHY